MSGTAKAIEARRAETLGSVHESAVAQPFAMPGGPTLNPTTAKNALSKGSSDE